MFKVLINFHDKMMSHPSHLGKELNKLKPLVQNSFALYLNFPAANDNNKMTDKKEVPFDCETGYKYMPT